MKDDMRTLEDFVIQMNIVKFITFLFTEPTEPQAYKDVQKSGIAKDLGVYFQGGELLASFFENLEAVEFYTIKEEYQRLFMGPNMIMAPMWSSFYTDEKALLFGETTFQVRELYARAGKAYILKNQEPEDHLLIELEFIAYLFDALVSGMKADCFDEGLYAIYVEMIENHFAKWVPQFVERVEKYAQLPLYIGSAKLLANFLAEESAYIHT